MTNNGVFGGNYRPIIMLFIWGGPNESKTEFNAVQPYILFIFMTLFLIPLIRYSKHVACFRGIDLFLAVFPP